MNLLAIIDVMAVMAYVYYTKLAYLQSEVLFQRIAVRSTKTSFQPWLVEIVGWYIACYLDVEQTERQTWGVHSATNKYYMDLMWFLSLLTNDLSWRWRICIVREISGRAMTLLAL